MTMGSTEKLTWGDIKRGLSGMWDDSGKEKVEEPSIPTQPPSIRVHHNVLTRMTVLTDYQGYRIEIPKIWNILGIDKAIIEAFEEAGYFIHYGEET